MSAGTFRKSPLFRFIAFTVLAAFVGMLPASPSYAQVAIVMPPPGQMIHVTSHFEPPQMVGLKIDMKDPFSFDFIMDQGQTPMSDDVKKEEFNKIVKYFLVALAMPNKDMWVNLSPYESKRIIPEIFAQTEMGRDLLAQDYILKQFTASLMYPEDGLGKKFWDKVYAQAQARFGTTEINVNTFNKVWIVADNADIYQKDDTAFLVRSHLKVMLEQDYKAIEKNKEMFGSAESVNVDESKDAKTQMASQLVREIIIPAIEKEVNEGQSFAAVRQVYNAEIMATWFKKTLHESLLGQVFANKSKIDGQKVSDPQAMEKIYHQYLKAYKKGVFNYIREDATPDGQTIPRKYFSGGMENINQAMVHTLTPEILSRSPQAAREVGDFAQSTMSKLSRYAIASVLLTSLTGCAFLDPTSKDFLNPDAQLEHIQEQQQAALDPNRPISAGLGDRTWNDIYGGKGVSVLSMDVASGYKEDKSDKTAKLLNIVGGVTLVKNGSKLIFDSHGNLVAAFGGGLETTAGGVLVAGVGVPATIIVGTVEYAYQGGKWVAQHAWDGTKWAATKVGEGVQIVLKPGEIVVGGVATYVQKVGPAEGRNGVDAIRGPLNTLAAVGNVLPDLFGAHPFKTDFDRLREKDVTIRDLISQLAVANQNVQNITITANQSAESANQNAQALADAQQKITDITQKLTAAIEDSKNLQAQAQSNSVDYQATITKALAAVKDTQAKLDQKSIDLQAALKTVDDQKTLSAQERTDAKKVLDDQIHQNDLVKGQLSDIKGKLDTLQGKYDDVTGKLTAARISMGERDTTITQLNAEIEKNKNLITELEIALGVTVLGGVLAFFSGKSRGKKKVQADLDASNIKIADLQAKLKATQDKDKKDLEDSQAVAASLQNEIEGLKASLEKSITIPPASRRVFARELFSQLLQLSQQPGADFESAKKANAFIDEWKNNDPGFEKVDQDELIALLDKLGVKYNKDNFNVPYVPVQMRPDTIMTAADIDQRIDEIPKEDRPGITFATPKEDGKLQVETSTAESPVPTFASDFFSQVTGLTAFSGELYIAYLDSTDNNKPAFARINLKEGKKGIQEADLPAEVKEKFGLNPASIPASVTTTEPSVESLPVTTEPGTASPVSAPAVSLEDKLNAEIASLQAQKDAQRQRAEKIVSQTVTDLNNPENSSEERQNWFLGKGRFALLNQDVGYDQVKFENNQKEAYYISKEREAASGATFDPQQVLASAVQKQEEDSNAKIDAINSYKEHLQAVHELNKRFAEEAKLREEKMKAELPSITDQLRVAREMSGTPDFQEQKRILAAKMQEISGSSEDFSSKVNELFDVANAAAGDARAQSFNDLNQKLAEIAASQKYATSQEADQLKEEFAQAKLKQDELEKIPAVKATIDKAQNVGGINLSDENLIINIKVDGAGMPLAAQFQDKTMTDLDGLTSVIRRITPVTQENAPALFALVQ